MQVKLITATPEAEKLIAYTARVSNPANQDSDNIEGLLKYCATHGHWSIFEMANVVIEIETSRAIAAQILRHRSFSFQEFSQRYSSDMLELEYNTPRRQDNKNRQNSIDDLSYDAVQDFKHWQKSGFDKATDAYAIATGELEIARESARMLLPLATKTRLYMNGTMRSWIHYLSLRSANGTQKEHIDIANAIIDVFKKEFPLIHRIIVFSQKSQEELHRITKDMEI